MIQKVGGVVLKEVVDELVHRVGRAGRPVGGSLGEADVGVSSLGVPETLRLVNLSLYNSINLVLLDDSVHDDVGHAIDDHRGLDLRHSFAVLGGHRLRDENCVVIME